MNLLFTMLVIIAIALAVAWNVLPGLRERLRGWTTILEAGLMAVLPFIGNAIDAFQETDWKQFVPQTAWPYVIAGLAAWFIFKRVVTSTAVGTQQ
jgi:uncharacterized membrane protein